MWIEQWCELSSDTSSKKVLVIDTKQLQKQIMVVNDMTELEIVCRPVTWTGACAYLVLHLCDTLSKETLIGA